MSDQLKLRYRLHWASGDAPKPSLKWVICDWQKPICRVAYTETRKLGRKVCDLLNAEETSRKQGNDNE